MWRRRQVSDRIRVSAPQVSPQMSMTGASFLLEQSETIIWKRRCGRRPRLQSSKSSRELRLSRMENDTWRMPSGPCKTTTTQRGRSVARQWRGALNGALAGERAGAPHRPQRGVDLDARDQARALHDGTSPDARALSEAALANSRGGMPPTVRLFRLCRMARSALCLPCC